MRIYTPNKFARSRAVKRQLLKTKKTISFNFGGVGATIQSVFKALEERPFVAQVFGIAIITVAIIVSFQTLVDVSSPKVLAGQNDNEVRVLSNFHTKSVDGKNVQSVIEEIAPPQPKVVEKKEVKVESNDKNSVETKVTPEKTPEKKEVKPQFHVVASGETLSEITKLYGITVDEIVKLNGIEDPAALQVGMKLVVG
jgi:LysM repeat protein